MLFGLTDIVSIEIRGTVVAKAFIPLFRIILLRVSLLGMYLICTVDFFSLKSYFDTYLCFVDPLFRVWFLVTFDDEVTKIWKYYVIFVYILQGKMGKTEKRKSSN